MTENPQSRRILRNILSGFSTWILPLFLGLFVTRVVVRSLGHEEYGLYALVLGFIAYSFNFNVGRAVTRFLAHYRAAGETEKIRGIISATALVTIAVGGVGLILVLALSSWLVTDVFHIEPAAQAKTIIALRIAGVTIFVFLIAQIANAVLQGLHRIDIFSNIQNANSAVLMLGNLWLAYNGYGLLALLYWSLFSTTFSTILSFAASRRLLPEMGFDIKAGNEAISLVLKYSVGVVGFQVASNAFLLFERSWIISKLGSESLTFYVIPMTVGIYLHSFISSILLWLFPLMSEFTGSIEKLTRLYQAATKSVLFIVVITTVTLICAGKLFLTLWLGPDFGERSSQLLSVQSIAFGLAALCIVSFHVSESAGHPGVNFRNTAIGVVLGAVVMVLLTQRIGLLGISYGRVLAFVVLFVGIFGIEHRFLGGIKWRFWSAILVRFTTAAASAAVVELLLLNYLSPRWLSLIVVTILGGAVYTGILYLIGFASASDKALLNRVLKLREI